MNVFKAIQTRRSIRKYTSQQVSEDDLQKILQAGRLAPSAKNLQNWQFIVITDTDIIAKLAEACNQQHFISEVPVVIAGIADPTINHWYELDMGIAFDHMALVATDCGLGSCWIGAFNEPQVRDILSIPKKLRTIILMTIGYAAENPAPRPRKPLSAIIRYDYY